jgi:hypothetical protein
MGAYIVHRSTLSASKYGMMANTPLKQVKPLNKLKLGVAAVIVGFCLYLAHPLAIEATDAEATTPNTVPIAAQSSNEQALVTKAPDSATSELDLRISRWIEVIGSEPGFEAWQDAVWNRYPLGPGTHGWVIHVRHDQQEIGYLIVHSTPDGDYMLQEYGNGDYSLFSLNTLHQTLVQHGLIQSSSDLSEDQLERVYLNALHSVWRAEIGGEVYYADAKTGELLPLEDEHIEKMLDHGSVAVTFETELNKIEETKAVPDFDPFYNVHWLTDPPLVLEDQHSFRLAMHHEAPITYSAHLFGRTILCAFAVNGYHTWNDDIAYVSIDHEGNRYIPYRLLAELGSFYQ